MKNNGKQKLLTQIARRGFVLVGLLAMSLICATSGRAQASATTTSAQDAKYAVSPMAPVQSPAATAKPALVPAKVAESPEEKPPAKGAKEGIVVHGHWTIVVKNPDGTVAARHEFENTLDPLEGADLLTGMLSGEYTTTGFFVDLSSAGSGTICGASDCIISDSRDPGVCVSFGTNCGTLTYSVNTGAVNKNAIGFTLSGSATLLSTDSGTITIVGTGILACLPSGAVVSRSGATTLQANIANAAAGTAFVAGPPGATSNFLSSCAPQSGRSSVGTLAGLLLTSRSISQPVTGGQSVAVTVVITFSGS